MPSMLALTSLIGGYNASTRRALEDNNGSSSDVLKRKSGHPVEVHGVRLLQLTERESSVMKVSEVEENSAFDPVVNTFRAFGRLHTVPRSGEVAVVPESYYADTLTSRASDISSHLLLLPWSETGSLSEFRTLLPETLQTKLASTPYQDFVRSVLEQNDSSHTGIFINDGFGGATRYGPRKLSRTLSGISMRSQPETASLPNINQNHHIFLPFFGFPDDRVAVRFVLQLARDSRLSVTIVHFSNNGNDSEGHDISQDDVTPRGERSTSGKADATSSTNESIQMQERNQSFLVSMRTSLAADVASRVDIQTHDSTTLDNILDQASNVLSRAGSNAGNLVVLGRNSHHQGDVCLGGVADALIKRDLGTSLLVVQARRKHS